MKRNLFGISICILVATFCSSAESQQSKKLPRIGYISLLGFRPLLSTSLPPDVEAFYRGLRDQGFTPGKNVIIDYKFAEGQPGRLRQLAAELVTSQVDLIFATSTPTINAARNATSKTPIVVVFAGDPVASELVDTLSRPGGNITGVSGFRPDLNGKLLELLSEAVPRASQVGVLCHTSSSGLSVVESAARALSLKLKVLPVRSRDDLEKTFTGVQKDNLGALLILPAVLFTRSEKLLAEFAIHSRLPAIYWRSNFVERGGFMSYGPNSPALFQRAGVLAGKVLKGTKPADLPMEQSMKFDLLINLKTANQLSVTIPPNVLARADRVIR